MVYSVATAAHGLSSFSSYQCAAAAKAAVSSVAMVTHVVVLTTAVAVTVAATTLAVAKLKITRFLPKGRFSFCIITAKRLKISNGGADMSKESFTVGYPADISRRGILPVTDPFSESQRSKSKEHTDRFADYKIFQKTEKNEEITS